MDITVKTTGPELQPKAASLIVWTLQRVGGRHLTQQLLALTGLPAAEHEPFKVSGAFGRVTAAWLQNKDEAQLREAIRAICQRRTHIQHDIEEAPWEVSRCLLEESSATGYSHLFMYRQHARDRLLSLHFTRQDAVWEPDTHTNAAVRSYVFAQPLPVAKLVLHENYCVDLLNRLWEAALRLDQTPVALAFEDVFSGDQTRARARLLSMLAELGLSRGAAADQGVVQRLLSTIKPGGLDRYGSFAGAGKLAAALVGVARFPPAPVTAPAPAPMPASAPGPATALGCLQATRLSQGHPWIARAVIDSVPAVFPQSSPVTIGGVVVLSPSAPKDAELVIEIAGQTSSVTWSIASQKMKQEFPNSPNSGHARFKINCALCDGDALLMLRAGAPGEPSLPLFELRMVPAAMQKGFERIASLSAKQAVSQDEYLSLRQALDGVAPDERRVPWLKASIWLDGTQQKNASGAFKQIAALRKMCMAADVSHEFNAFFDSLSTAIHPFSIGPHGFQKALASRPQQPVWAAIGELETTVNALGGQCFINSGTLLGAIRDGQLIAHDDDVDLAVILKGDSLAAVVAEWRRMKDALRHMGLLSRKFEEKMGTHAKIGHAGGASVDLFPAWILQDRVYVWPHTCGDLPAASVLPLRELAIEGVVVHVPSEPERMLVCNYGPGWNSRDPGFRFDWPQARQRFADFIRLEADAGSAE